MRIEKLAEGFGFKEKDGMFENRYGNFTFYLSKYQVDALSHINAFVVVFSKTLSKEVRKEIQRVHGIPIMRVESIGLIDNAVILPVKHKPGHQRFDQYINRLLELFEKLELKSLDYCPYCGEGETDGFRKIKGARLSVHESCVKSFVQKVEGHLENEGKSNKYMLKSIVFAILGGIIGLMPSIIILELFEFYSAWLFLLITVTSFYGFKKGGAQRRSYVVVLVALITLILTVGYMLSIYLSIADYFEVTLPVLLEDGEFMASFIQDMLTTFLFTLLAIFVSWKAIQKQTHGAIKKDIQSLK